MTWDDVAEMVAHWGGQFCLKGVMSVEDAPRRRHRLHRHRAVEPRWPPARWLAQRLRPAGRDRRRGGRPHRRDDGRRRAARTHVLKALSLGAKAVGLGRYYLFPWRPPAGSGARAGSDAGGDRAGVAVDGVQVGGELGRGICGSGRAGMDARRARLGRAVSLRPCTCMFALRSPRSDESAHFLHRPLCAAYADPLRHRFAAWSRGLHSVSARRLSLADSSASHSSPARR